MHDSQSMNIDLQRSLAHLPQLDHLRLKYQLLENLRTTSIILPMVISVIVAFLIYTVLIAAMVMRVQTAISANGQFLSLISFNFMQDIMSLPYCIPLITLKNYLQGSRVLCSHRFY